jgi:hypothetical protein
MKADRRALVAAALWAAFSLLLWNVVFDHGVRLAAVQYVLARTAYLEGQGPPVGMAAAMHAGIATAARRATIVAAPAVLVCLLLLGAATRPTSSGAPRSGEGHRAARLLPPAGSAR